VAPEGTRVRLAIRPEDVTLALAPLPAGGSSARNVLAGAVSRLTSTEAGVRVVLDCGFSLVATVTRRSASDLGLAEGMPITAVFKASAVHLLPGAGSLDTPTDPRL
jgi:molybdopterin-binding protein